MSCLLNLIKCLIIKDEICLTQPNINKSQTVLTYFMIFIYIYTQIDLLKIYVL